MGVQRNWEHLPEGIRRDKGAIRGLWGVLIWDSAGIA